MPRCPSLTHNGFVLPNTGNRLLTLTIPYFTELHRLYPINGPRPVAVTRVVWGIWPPSNTLLLRISCLFLFKSAEFSRTPFFGDLLTSHLLSLAVALLDTTLETICLWDLASTLLTITRVFTGMAWGNTIDFTINNWKKNTLSHWLWLKSQTLWAYVLHSLWDQVSHPYKTTCKFTVVLILFFTLLGSKLFGRLFCTKWQQTFPKCILLVLISFWA